MAKKRVEEIKKIDRSKNLANVISILTIIFLSGTYIVEVLLAEVPVMYGVAVVIILASLVIVSIVIKNTANHKLAFNIPILLFMFYMLLMQFSGWHNTYFLYVCLFLCVISCLYASYYRTIFFIVTINVLIGLLLIRGDPVGGAETPFHVTLILWAICLFGSLIMLVITRYATIILNRAVEHQTSLNNLLATTENFIAILDERNEIVYASKTLAHLGNTQVEEMVQGRPFIDIFPGRSLKVFAGKLLKEKSSYTGDWEFTLDGQKRYFKAASHSLPGESGGALISLYDMTHLAERDEIAAMKDSMRIGLFFMDKNYIIQDHYSRYLEELLSDTKLFGKLFTDVIADSVTPSELEAIKDYFNMVLEQTYDLDMLEEINPLNELHYVNRETGSRKVFQCVFSTVERDRGEVFVLVTIYDITLRVELQQRLAEEEARRQEEMQSVFELIQVEPDVFSDFMADLEHEFDTIDKTQKSDTLSAHETLVKVYQSVHAIKSNAVILGLNVFGNKVHNLESKIKRLREVEGEVPFVEMLNLTMDIEKISNEKEKFRDIIDKLHKHVEGAGTGTEAGAVKGKTEGEKQNVKILIDSLVKTTAKAGEDMNKLVKFIASEVEAEAIEKGPRRNIKEILVQLIRNSVVHGIELPEERTAKGKKETGTIKLSIKMTEDHKHIHMKLTDDGRGLDYKKIAERALNKNLIKEEDANNKDILMKTIFAPGFSTAETEGMHAGRGIGLNLVRDRIKEVNGTIKLRSEEDKGIVFLVSIPI